MTDRLDRRAVMAVLLLMASPKRLQDLGHGDAKLSVNFDSIAELRTWLDDAGLSGPDLLIGEHTFTDEDGRSYRSMAAYPRWHGWEIYASAIDSTDPVSLDEDTRDALTALVSGAGVAL